MPFEETRVGSSSAKVTLTVAATEVIGLSNNVERLSISSISKPSEALPAHLLLK